mgnify:CR=1 FL=1
MNIENEVKLDYSSVLLRPKRSTLGSRKEVKLTRRHTFRNFKPNLINKQLWDHKNKEFYDFGGVPIMAANMDGVGTFTMAEALGKLGLFTCLVKTYSIKQLVEFFNTSTIAKEHVAYSMGITDDDATKFRAVYAGSNNIIKYVCIDVANGYSERLTTLIVLETNILI